MPDLSALIARVESAGPEPFGGLIAACACLVLLLAAMLVLP